MSELILEIENLKVTVKKKNKPHEEIIRGIDLAIPKGEIVGIVGESGSGKSITMKAIMNILPEGIEKVQQNFLFDGKEVTDKAPMSAAMIFQDPMTALNPLRTIGYHLVEVAVRHQKVSKKEGQRLALAELHKVGISLPEKRFGQYPHELSGGMRQRVMIAMALLAKPKFLIADEPTTALDVTIQAQILGLIRNLQKEEDLSVILVTHDMGIVAGLCQSIKVMYQGEIVEEGKIDEVFYSPKHPYTIDLLKAIPTGKKGERLYSLEMSQVDEKNKGISKFVTVSPTHRYLEKEVTRKDA